MNNFYKNAREFWCENKVLILIILLSLFIRAFFFYQTKPWEKEVIENRILVFDAIGYQTRALGIFNTGTFSSMGVFRTPGYPLFIAFVYCLFGTKIWAVLLIQILLDVGTTVIVYFLAKILFESKSISAIAAFLYSIDLLAASNANAFLSDILFTFVFALSILAFICALKEKKTAYIILTGFFMGAATLIRPVLLYFSVIPIFVLLVDNSKSGRKALNIAALLLTFAAVLSPWQFRNYRIYGHYALTNTGGLALLDFAGLLKSHIEGISQEEARKELLGFSAEQFDYPDDNTLIAQKQSKAKTYLEARDELDSVPSNGGVDFDLFVESDIWRKISMQYITEHPVEYLRLHLKSAVNFFMGIGQTQIRDALRLKKIKQEDMNPSIFIGIGGEIRKLFRYSLDGYFIVPILLMILLLEYIFLIIGGCGMFFRKEHRLYIIFFVLAISYFPAITGLISYSRYRIPIIPLCLVLSAKGIFDTVCFFRKSKAMG